MAIEVPGEGDESATNEPLWVLLAKVASAMALADIVSRALGYSAPTLAVITAGFIAAQPTSSSIGKAIRRFAASMVGVAMGAISAWLARLIGLPWAFAAFAIGAVAGAWRTKSNDYLYVAVVGIVVAHDVESGDMSIGAVALEQTILATVACTVAPLTVVVIDALLGRMRSSG